MPNDAPIDSTCSAISREEDLSVPRVIRDAARWVSPDFVEVWTRSPPAKKHRAAMMSAVGFSVTKTTMPFDNTKRSLIRCDIVSDKFYSPTYKKQTLDVVTGDTFNLLSLRQI